MDPFALIDRRDFLLVFGAGGVAAVASAAKTGPSPDVREPSPPEPSGYRETDHIRNYYKTTAT